MNQMNPDDIEGEEAGDSFVVAEEEVKFTPFNMKEELEEVKLISQRSRSSINLPNLQFQGHFDNEGHYHFKKNNENHLDNWLDDIDWVKVKKDENYKKKYYTAEGEYSSDEDEEEAASAAAFDPLSSFKSVLGFMKPAETVNAALQRINKSRVKLTTAQKWKMKKQGITDESSEAITKLTGIVNEILTRTGNMNVYELTYEQIQHKIKVMEDKAGAGPSGKVELDMYADDFDEKEQSKLGDKTVTFKEPQSIPEDNDESKKLMWEYKIKQDDDVLHGPFTTEQMLKKTENGEFKENVFCRKIGDERFYSSSRVDFDLYL